MVLVFQRETKLSLASQDRVATFAPLFAVIIFLIAIVLAIGYLRIEELDREQETITRDLEYAQQRLRLHILDRQERLNDIANALIAGTGLCQGINRRATGKTKRASS